MKKQIDFNHELIGKEGITVERRDGVGIDFVKVYQDYILCVTNLGITMLRMDGKRINNPDDTDLLMFTEIKEMSSTQYVESITYRIEPSERYFLAKGFDAGKQHIKDIHNIK